MSEPTKKVVKKKAPPSSGASKPSSARPVTPDPTKKQGSVKKVVKKPSDATGTTKKVVKRPSSTSRAAPSGTSAKKVTKRPSSTARPSSASRTTQSGATGTTKKVAKRPAAQDPAGSAPKRTASTKRAAPPAAAPKKEKSGFMGMFGGGKKDAAPPTRQASTKRPSTGAPSSTAKKPATGTPKVVKRPSTASAATATKQPSAKKVVKKPSTSSAAAPAKQASARSATPTKKVVKRPSTASAATATKQPSAKKVVKKPSTTTARPATPTKQASARSATPTKKVVKRPSATSAATATKQPSTKKVVKKPSTTAARASTPTKQASGRSATPTKKVVKRPSATPATKEPSTKKVVKKPSTTARASTPTKQASARSATPTKKVVKRPSATSATKEPSTKKVVKKPSTTARASTPTKQGSARSATPTKKVVKRPSATSATKEPSTKVVKKPSTTDRASTPTRQASARSPTPTKKVVKRPSTASAATATKQPSTKKVVKKPSTTSATPTKTVVKKPSTASVASAGKPEPEKRGSFLKQASKKLQSMTTISGDAISGSKSDDKDAKKVVKRPSTASNDPAAKKVVKKPSTRSATPTKQASARSATPTKQGSVKKVVKRPSSSSASASAAKEPSAKKLVKKPSTTSARSTTPTKQDSAKNVVKRPSATSATKQPSAKKVVKRPSTSSDRAATPTKQASSRSTTPTKQGSLKKVVKRPSATSAASDKKVIKRPSSASKEPSARAPTPTKQGSAKKVVKRPSTPSRSDAGEGTTKPGVKRTSSGADRSKSPAVKRTPSAAKRSQSPSAKKVASGADRSKSPAVKRTSSTTDRSKSPGVKRTPSSADRSKSPGMKRSTSAADRPKSPGTKRTASSADRSKSPGVKRSPSATKRAQSPSAKKSAGADARAPTPTRSGSAKNVVKRPSQTGEPTRSASAKKVVKRPSQTSGTSAQPKSPGPTRSTSVKKAGEPGAKLVKRPSQSSARAATPTKQGSVKKVVKRPSTSKQGSTRASTPTRSASMKKKDDEKGAAAAVAIGAAAAAGTGIAVAAAASSGGDAGDAPKKVVKRPSQAGVVRSPSAANRTKSPGVPRSPSAAKGVQSPEKRDSFFKQASKKLQSMTTISGESISGKEATDTGKSPPSPGVKRSPSAAKRAPTPTKSASVKKRDAAGVAAGVAAGAAVAGVAVAATADSGSGKPPPARSQSVKRPSGAPARAKSPGVQRAKSAAPVRAKSPGVQRAKSAAPGRAKIPLLSGRSLSAKAPAGATVKKRASVKRGRPYELIVVESPTKCDTLSTFLEEYIEANDLRFDYMVASTMGATTALAISETEKEVMDGSEVDQNYSPSYETLPGKEVLVQELLALAGKARKVVIATDEGVDGEMLAWQLTKVLEGASLRAPPVRVVAPEITAKAVREAISEPRPIDTKLAEATETLQIMDNLVEKTISPILAKKISPDISVGRLEMLGLKLMVQRERERYSFQSAKYCVLKAAFFDGIDSVIEANMVSLNGQPLASEYDFDSTGEMVNPKKLHLTSDAADELQKAFFGNEDAPEMLTAATWTVGSVKSVKRSQSPPKPFTMATLLQEAADKLNMSASQTMTAAMSLYETGYISYPRTESFHMSDEAQVVTDKVVSKEYGEDMVAPPRGAVKGATSFAEEAVRPAIQPDGLFTRPSDLDPLESSATRLYKLVYDRTLASRMSPLVVKNTTAEIIGTTADKDKTIFLQANGTVVVRAGYTMASGSGAASDILPPLLKGQKLKCTNLSVVTKTTQPPTRFSELDLVTEMESLWLARPSSSLKTIGTLKERGYVGSEDGDPLAPSLSAFVVFSALEKSCPKCVDLGYHTQMQERLSDIADGVDDSENSRVAFLNEFYAGEDGFAAQAKKMDEEVTLEAARRAELPKAIFGNETEEQEIGLFMEPEGPYAQMVSNRLSMKLQLTKEMVADVSAIDQGKVRSILTDRGVVIGPHPDDSRNIWFKVGDFGSYLQWGDDGAPNTTEHPIPEKYGGATGLHEGLEPTAAPRVTMADLSSIPLDYAVAYVSLPRKVCILNGKPILAGLGPYGPYLNYNKTFVKLAEKEGDVLTVDHETAKRILTNEILNNSSSHRRGGKSIELGQKQGRTVRVEEGKFLTWKGRKTRIPSQYTGRPEEFPLEAAWALVKVKGARGKSLGKKSKSQRSKSRRKFNLATPRTPFEHFCDDKKPAVMKSIKKRQKDTPREERKELAMKELEGMWEELDEEAKKKYEGRSAAEKARYDEEMKRSEAEKEAEGEEGEKDEAKDEEEPLPPVAEVTTAE